MHTLLHLLSLLAIAATTVLASPANNSGGPALLVRRSFSGDSVYARRTADAYWSQTNAQRLARGLTPSPPKQLFTPSRVRRQLPSSSPTITASIGVFKSDGTRSGYMGSQGTIATTQSSATTFLFRDPTSASDLVELNNYGSNTRTVFASYTNSYTVGPGSTNTLMMSTTTLSTPAGSTQQADLTKGPTQYSESTVWSIDPNTGVVSAYWVNPDGSQVPVYFVQRTMTTGTITTMSMIAVGDANAYVANHPTLNLAEVTLVVSV